MTKLRDAKKKAGKGKKMEKYASTPTSKGNQSIVSARYKYGPLMIENDYKGGK